MEAALQVSRARIPRLQIVDFSGDPRLVELSGARDALAADMAGAMPLLDVMGVRYRAKGGKRWRPTRRISWLGFASDAFRGVAKLEGRNVEDGLRSREGIFEAA